ncbi:MAG: YCF48-related protein [Candidatus Omnitrophica bacterium]|nr:YCF48-related protein [Candidatus Omnitrophota bacterium]
MVFLFANCYCGEAQTWQDISSGLDELDIRTAAIDPVNPEIIYAGGQKTIFKTTDGGRSWSKVYSVRGQLTWINSISIDPKDTCVVYAGTANGLYKSSDGGKSWNRIFQGLSPQEKEIRNILIDSLDTKNVYIGTTNGIFNTNDAGKLWQKSTNEISNRVINFILQDPLNADVFYAASTNGVFKSIDHGKSYEEVFFAIAQGKEGEETNQDTGDEYKSELEADSMKTPNSIALSRLDPAEIYAGTEAGVFISKDGGGQWEKITDSGLINNNITYLISLKDGWLFSATKNGVFKITRPFEKWEELDQGLDSKYTRYLVYDQKNNFILAATTRGLYKMNLSHEDGPAGADIAQEDREVQELFGRFQSEPDVRQTQEAAIRYAEVHKKKIDEWRNRAKRRAILPKVSVGIDENEGDYYYGGAWKGKEGDTGWDVSLTWDLGELVWTSEQTNIDTRSRLMVQLRDDILNEITQLYFERRRLQIEMLTNPPKNVQTRIGKQLRLQELTAGIDALTGGWFSEQIK